jgi:hypothetical protein
MLISSLPYLPPLFSQKELPLSHIQLRQRLSMLKFDDAQVLKKIEEICNWDYHPMEKTDESIVIENEKIVPEFDKPLREILQWRLELRTVVAALRRRHLGMPQPQRGEKWGYGYWVNYIVRNWKEPNFELERFFPWVTDANRLLKEGDAAGLERLLLGLVWSYLNRFGENHYFNFVAVVVYILKWHLNARWARYNGVAAEKRFDDIVEQALGDFASIYS